jgi:hypothetical protein
VATVWNAATRQSFVDRVDRLTTAAAPRWGKFTVAGMLAHLNDSYRAATGELAVAPKNTFLRHAPIRQIVVYLLPVPKGLPTAPEFLARVKDASLADEQKAFHTQMERLGHIMSESQLAAHPAFGNLTYHEYGVLMAKHTDHHLRQFGV